MIRLEIVHIGYYILEVLIPEPNRFEVKFKNLHEDETYEYEFDTWEEMFKCVNDFEDYFDEAEMNKFNAMLITYNVA